MNQNDTITVLFTVRYFLTMWYYIRGGSGTKWAAEIELYGRRKWYYMGSGEGKKKTLKQNEQHASIGNIHFCKINRNRCTLLTTCRWKSSPIYPISVFICECLAGIK